MRKLTVMAACAALLLGGTVCLKANQLKNSLFDANIEALTDQEYLHNNGTCCVKYRDNEIIIRCGISSAEVTFWSVGCTIINWCCDSCSKASYSF